MAEKPKETDGMPYYDATGNEVKPLPQTTASAIPPPDDDDWQGRACANIEAAALATCRQMLAEAESERDLLRTVVGSGQATEQAVAELAAAVLRAASERDAAESSLAEARRERDRLIANATAFERSYVASNLEYKARAEAAAARAATLEGALRDAEAETRRAASTFQDPLRMMAQRCALDLVSHDRHEHAFLRLVAAALTILDATADAARRALTPGAAQTQTTSNEEG
jgi:hypothetical protein